MIARSLVVEVRAIRNPVLNRIVGVFIIDECAEIGRICMLDKFSQELGNRCGFGTMKELPAYGGAARTFVGC